MAKLIYPQWEQEGVPYGKRAFLISAGFTEGMIQGWSHADAVRAINALSQARKEGTLATRSIAISPISTFPKPPKRRTFTTYKELRALPYSEFLQTNYWKKRRDKALNRYGFKCQLCNSKKNLNVHHRTYDRLGRERNSDLIVLCRMCHAKFHDKLPYQGAV